MTEIILGAIIVGQSGIIFGLVWLIVKRVPKTVNIAGFEEKRIRDPLEFKPINLPTAEQLEEKEKPTPIREAENAMRTIFKKISGR